MKNQLKIYEILAREQYLISAEEKHLFLIKNQKRVYFLIFV